MYSYQEIKHTVELVQELGLRCLDLHATDGGTDERYIVSPYKWSRLAGIELIRNRIQLAQALGARAIVLHAPPEPTDPEDLRRFWSRMNSALDRIGTIAAGYRVKVAWENTDTLPKNTSTIYKILDSTNPGWSGVCYDSGHGTLHGDGVEFLTSIRDRLYALHLNDNHGRLKVTPSDLHMIPFDGKTDWNAVIEQIALSSYEGPLSFEVGRSQYQGMSTPDYLAKVVEAGTKLTQMLVSNRASL